MSTFRLYLWKEWREQRTALLALALSLPVLVVAVGYSLPRRQVAELFVGIVGALALLVSLMVVGGEVLSSDHRRGTWLERLPRGLEGAFPAKLVAFGLVSLSALAYGNTLGAVVALLRGQEFALRRLSLVGLDFTAWLTLGAIGALWTFAASAWCTRGALATIAGALCAVVVGSPMWVLWSHSVRFQWRYEPAPLEVAATAVVLLLGPILGAWVGFTRLRRLGREPLAVAWRGAAVSSSLALPLLAWSLVQLERRDDFDLGSPDCTIEDAWISADGSVAMITARMEQVGGWHRLASRALWIDVERGTVRDLNLSEPTFHELYTRPEGREEPRPLLRVVSEEGAFDHVPGQSELRTVRYLDAPFAWPAGLGWMTYEGSDMRFRFHDPFSGITRARDEILIDSSVCITPAGWLLHRVDWFLYDPRRDTLEAVEWIHYSFREVATSADGRVLLATGDGTLALADLETRTLREITGRVEDDTYLGRVMDGLGSPDELLIRDECQEYRVDLACLELIPLGLTEEEFLLRRLADGTLVVWTARGFEWRETDGTLQKSLEFAALKNIEEVTP